MRIESVRSARLPTPANTINEHEWNRARASNARYGETLVSLTHALTPSAMRRTPVDHVVDAAGGADDNLLACLEPTDIVAVDKEDSASGDRQLGMHYQVCENDRVYKR